MSALPVTPELLHALVSGAHVEGIAELAVQCAIVHEDRLLLLIEPGLDFEDTRRLPQGPVLPGEALDDAVCRALAMVGLTIDEMIGYVGHHDDDKGASEITRVLCFAVTVTDPTSPCRFATFGHQWPDLADLPDLPLRSELSMIWLAGTPIPHKSPSPSLAKLLLAGASGLVAAEAAIELLTGHATWLARNDFRERFVHRLRRNSACDAMAVIDWAGAITALDAGELPCSGSEGRMLRLAASLADGIAVDLGTALVGLDSANIELVSQTLLRMSR